MLDPREVGQLLKPMGKTRDCPNGLRFRVTKIMQENPDLYGTLNGDVFWYRAPQWDAESPRDNQTKAEAKPARRSGANPPRPDRRTPIYRPEPGQD